MFLFMSSFLQFIVVAQQIIQAFSRRSFKRLSHVGYLYETKSMRVKSRLTWCLLKETKNTKQNSKKHKIMKFNFLNRKM